MGWEGGEKKKFPFWPKPSSECCFWPILTILVHFWSDFEEKIFFEKITILLIFCPILGPAGRWAPAPEARRRPRPAKTEKIISGAVVRLRGPKWLAL